MVPLISDFENQRLVKDADNHQSQSELAHKKRRAFLELQLLTQLDHSRFRTEDKDRRDMNENSSEINKLLRPRFSIPSDAKEKLDQKDGASEAKLALYMTETSNNVAFRDQIPGKKCVAGKDLRQPVLSVTASYPILARL